MFDTLIAICLHFAPISVCECTVQKLIDYEINIFVEEIPKDMIYTFNEECWGNEA